MTNAIQLSLSPRVPALVDGQRTSLDVLVRLQAPDVPADLPERPPLNLALVIDRSGSMAGRPLEAAKAAAQMMVEALGSQDRISVVTFESGVRVDVPNRCATPHDEILRHLVRIESGGTTALHEGWLRGAEQAAHRSADGVISRVLLLTDGHANQGKTDPRSIAEDVGRVAASGITTTTYGLGHDFDEVLLGEMAERGRGGCHYGEGPEDLMEPFRAELGLLDALFTQGVRLELTAAPGVELTVLNPYRQDADGAWMLPDLAYGAEVWALVRAEVPAGTPSNAFDSPAETPVLTARATFLTRSGESGRTDAVPLALPRLTAEAVADTAEDPHVVRRAQEVRAADFQSRARAAAMAGNWDEVDRVAEQARAESDGHGWIENMSQELSELSHRRAKDEIVKTAFYSSRALSGGTRDKYEMETEALDDGYSMAREVSKPAFLRRKRSPGRSSERIIQEGERQVRDADAQVDALVDRLAKDDDVR